MINDVKQIHDKGVYHLCIKPENFMLNSKDEVFLVDFGLSNNIDKKKYKCGTSQYICRELLEIGSQSKNSDIYSLAYSIYELLSQNVDDVCFWSVVFKLL